MSQKNQLVIVRVYSYLENSFSVREMNTNQKQQPKKNFQYGYRRS